MIILGTNSIKDTGYNVANSARFDNNAYMSQTWGSSGNRRTWTLSMWIKYSGLNDCRIFSIGDNVSSNMLDFFIGSGILRVQDTQGDETLEFRTTQLFRDPSAWSHLVFACDTTQGTEGNRFKIYHNGTQITSFGTENYPTQNLETLMNHTVGAATVGARAVTQSGSYFNGYMAEVVVLDGTAAAPTSFGEFDEDSGIWKPIDVSGLTFGTNGFYLDFKDSSNLGNDANGGSDFSETNFAATDQSTDTCTNNFATLNPLDGVIVLGNSTFSEGNLRFNSETNGNKCWMRSTIGVTSGKWYFEAKVQTAGNNCAIGITDRPSANLTNELGGRAFEYSYQSANSGNKLNNGSGSSYGDTYTDDDIVSCALDLDNLKIYFGKNGTFQNSGDPTSGATGTGAAFTITAPSLTITGFYFFALGDLSGASNTRWLANFGSPPYAISSGNADGNGYGNFEYAVPSGYYSLNTKNLAEYG